MSRPRFTWTERQHDKLNKVKAILEELGDYKPLTLRQVYYQMVGKGFIENSPSEYGMLSKLLKWARIGGLVAWSDIEDRTRSFHSGEGWENREAFIESEVDEFLTGYRRDLLQDQDIYIEAWIEKDALSSIFRRACSRYGVNVVVCKGFSSVSFLNEFRERIDAHADKRAVMLYFGDFDPSGMAMLPAMETTLGEELEIPGIEYKRIALLKPDIFTYELPHDPRAIKEKDKRTKAFVAEHGRFAVELDALRPDVLTQKIEQAIKAELDAGRFNAQVALHEGEVDEITTLRDQVKAMIGGET